MTGGACRVVPRSDLPESWPRYSSGQFPTADELYRSTLKFPVPHDDTALADAYVQAFQKVWTHYDELEEGHPA